MKDITIKGFIFCLMGGCMAWFGYTESLLILWLFGASLVLVGGLAVYGR